MNALPLAIARAYRWQRSLGNVRLVLPWCHLVKNPARPDVWDANHIDEVTAITPAEIDAVFAEMERLFRHTSWRVVHTDGFTPDAFIARLAFEDFVERPATIQMALEGEVRERGARIELRPVIDETDWQALLELVLADHAEGAKSTGLDLSPEFSASMTASYRDKSADYHFHLAVWDDAPVAYGAFAVAPNGVGMIEDLFTLPSARRQGVATAIIAAFVDRLRASGCEAIFLGALASEAPKRLYARLGFRPLSLARSWVREKPAPDL
jgi:GNAT superfamily N-acetyltransferase